MLFFILGILDKCPITVSFDSDVDCNKYEKILECTELLHEDEANAKEDAKSITGNLVTSGSCCSEPGCMAVLGEASIKNWYFFTFSQNPETQSINQSMFIHLNNPQDFQISEG